MPHVSGYVDNTSQSAHYALLGVVRQTCLTAGWEVLRYDTAAVDHELILRTTTGAVVGLRTYQDVAADYYNLLAAGMSSYDVAATFDTQPGVVLSGVPAHPERIDYWLTVNSKRLVLALKVGEAAYESLYLGHGNTYTRPVLYPNPLVVSGMLDGAAAVRFSDTAHSMGFKGGGTGANGVNNLRLRFGSGWMTPKAWPWVNNWVCGTAATLKTGDSYPLMPVVLYTATEGLLVELDGVLQISGVGLGVEDTLNVGGEDYLVIRDVTRTGAADYFAMRMD